MTAVAAPVQLQTSPRIGWTSVNGSQSGLSTMSQEEVGRMFMPGPRKSAQRSNSASSVNSLVSSSSTASVSSAASNGTTNSAESWETRKKAARGLWPSGKSQPTSELSTARPHSISTASSGLTAASGLTALHAPLLSSPQMAANQQQQHAAVRTPPPTEGSAFLYLLPMNGTFERKTINVPYYPDILRIGRQTNAKTAPTASNGFFDSKVLSRQHAEIYAEPNGRVYIRDVKSSNGTFVNGKRLSLENKESEPHELREQDVLELGIDIVSEDQKTVVHHKVAARVEHAGFYSQGGEIGLGDLDPANAGFVGSQPRQRMMGHPVMAGMKNGAQVAGAGSGLRDVNSLQHQWPRMWVQPISTENIVKRLNRELNLARQQSQDIDRARLSFSSMLEGKPVLVDQAGNLAANTRLEVNGFSEPPAPPPSQPLPEKPDVNRLLDDPAIQPLLQRTNTARPNAFDGGSADPVQALFVITNELKAAKDQIPDLQCRVQLLEQQLREERTARVNAEERAYQLEHGPRPDATQRAADEPSLVEGAGSHPNRLGTLQSQLDRLQANMVDMKQQMESYRRRAESAELQRDEARQSLAELIEEKRARMDAEGRGQHGQTAGRKYGQGSNVEDADLHSLDNSTGGSINGHTIRPQHSRPVALTALLAKAGVDGGKPLTRQQAANLQRVLRQEMLADEDPATGQRDGLKYHGIPHAAALTTVIVGLVVMRWLNGWEKIQR